MSRTPLLGLVIIVTLGVAACSSSATPAPAATTSGGGAGAQSVAIQDFSFQPASLTVSVGSTVTWTNKDNVGHTVTADDGSFKSGTIGGGATFTQTFARAGTYSYHCSIHAYMKATVTVQ